MKLLMIYTDRFAYTPAIKTLAEEPECSTPGEILAAGVGKCLFSSVSVTPWFMCP